MRWNVGGGPGAIAADGGAVDRISALPDHLLHEILVYLPCTSEAARTSVLSRRWRRVWTRLPELSFQYIIEPWNSPKAQDRVDAAMAACAASSTVIRRLEIRMPLMSNHATAELVSSWLRFAALRLAGELVLWLPAVRSDDDKDANQQDVVVPPCERVTAMGINYLMVGSTLRFPLSPAAGAFTALTLMKIRDACVDGRELGRVVSFCCPRLKEIVLTLITLRDEVGGLSIRSCSLERLEITYRPTEGRLQVATPELRSLTLDLSCDVYVLAPLSELEWRNYCYEPNRHRFEGAGSHLRRLGVFFANSTVVPLMQQFHTVDELNLTIIAPKHACGNESIFLRDIKDVVKSEVLVVRFLGEERVFNRTMLHLLTKFPGIRKLVVILSFSTPYYETYSLYCCPKSRELLALDSLEDVEIRSFKGSSEELEFLEQLVSRCNRDILEKVVINFNPLNTNLLSIAVCEEVRRICHPNVMVEANLCCGGKQVCKIYRTSDTGV